MEIVCPACRKNTTDSTLCPRCGCDISELSVIAETAVNYIAKGVYHLSRKNSDKALQYAQASWELRKSSDAALLGLYAGIHKNDSNCALKWLKYVQGVDKKL